jgi:hypothetical protein
MPSKGREDPSPSEARTRGTECCCALSPRHIPSAAMTCQIDLQSPAALVSISAGSMGNQKGALVPEGRIGMHWQQERRSPRDAACGQGKPGGVVIAEDDPKRQLKALL